MQKQAFRIVLVANYKILLDHEIERKIEPKSHPKGSQIGATGAQEFDLFDFGRFLEIHIFVCFWERPKVTLQSRKIQTFGEFVARGGDPDMEDTACPI